MTNAEMANAVDIMSSLNETGMLGYAIARNLRKMKDECTEYLNLRAELFQKYGTMDGDKAMVKGDNIQPFLDGLGDIPNIEHEVDIYKVPVDTFTSGTLTSAQMEALLFMVKEE